MKTRKKMYSLYNKLICIDYICGYSPTLSPILSPTVIYPTTVGAFFPNSFKRFFPNSFKLVTSCNSFYIFSRPLSALRRKSAKDSFHYLSGLNARQQTKASSRLVYDRNSNIGERAYSAPSYHLGCTLTLSHQNCQPVLECWALRALSMPFGPLWGVSAGLPA